MTKWKMEITFNDKELMEEFWKSLDIDKKQGVENGITNIKMRRKNGTNKKSRRTK